MITWLVGENSFEVREAQKALEQAFEGRAEYIDGTELQLNQLPDLLMGLSLFSTERLVVIRDITQNSHLWEKLPEWLPLINDTIHVVFVDTKPDKRTSSYKALKAAANLKEFPAWTERDGAKAAQWVGQRAKEYGLSLTPRLASYLVNRIGVDQWLLAQAIETLSLLDDVSEESIANVIPAHPSENIFQLFETALEGDAAGVSRMVATLSLTEDPYALFALLTSQALSLAAVTYADASAQPAKDFAIHPYVAGKLTRHAKALGKARVGMIVELFSRTDADMKRSKAEPWLLIERLLLQIARV